jgi:hypothetical protein
MRNSVDFPNIGRDMSRPEPSRRPVESQTNPGPLDQLQIDDLIMSIEECAELLHCHPVSLSLWAKQDRGPPRLTPPGVRKILYSKRQVLDWLQQGSAGESSVAV